MSFLNKLFKTIKDTTGIDAGNLADAAQKTAGYALMSKTAKGLAQLNWRWSEDAMMSDNGTGKPLRNWDRQTKLTPRLDDIYLSWEKQPVEFEEYMVFIGWSGWPYAIIEKDHPEQYFLPEYVEALADNKFNTVKYFTIKASEVPSNCVKFPAHKTDNEFYYVKLVGKTADEQFHDIKGCTLASLYQREKSQLANIPEGDIPEVKVPAGSRERNALEKELQQKAKAQKS